MKKASLILIFCCCIFQAFAQEMVAKTEKKLPQFYLGIGIGPSFNPMEGIKKQGVHLNANINWSGTNRNYYKAGLSITGFRDNEAPTPDHFMNNIFTHVNIISPGFLIGKQFTVSNSFQFRGFVGPSLNLFSFNDYVSPEEAAAGDEGSCFPEIYLRPGILLQAETMLWTSRFAGLSVGTYANVSFLVPSAGFNLNLNLGRIRTKEIL